MTIDPIANGESGSSVREKLNAAIANAQTPAWLPDGALLFMDFVNGHYYAQGAVVDDPADLMIFNADYGGDDVGLITASGWVANGGSSAFVLPGAVSTLFLVDGSTGVISGSASFGNAYGPEYVSLPDYDNDWFTALRKDIPSFGVYADPDGSPHQETVITFLGRNFTYAITSSSSPTQAGSINGQEIIALSSSGSWPVFTDIGFFINGSIAIQAITLYAPKPDAELPILSAIPVVQNGPAVLAPQITEVGSDLITNGTFAADGTIASFSDNGSGGTTVTLATGTTPTGIYPNYKASITGTSAYNGNHEVSNVIADVSFDIPVAFDTDEATGSFLHSWQLYDDSVWTAGQVFSTDDTGNPYFATGVLFPTVSGSWYKITFAQTISGDATGVYFDNNQGYWVRDEDNAVIVFQATFTGDDVLWIDFDQYNDGATRTVTGVEMIEVEQPVAALVVVDYLGHPMLNFGDGPDQVVAFGDFAGVGNTRSSVTALGIYSGYFNSGSGVTFIGDSAGYNNSGSAVIAIGPNAGSNNSGGDAVIVGLNAGINNTGQQLTAVGLGAGRNNVGEHLTAFGYAAGYGNDGDDNSVFGYVSSVAAGKHNSVAIGSGAQATDDNTIQLGNSSVNKLMVGNVEVPLQSSGVWTPVLKINADATGITYAEQSGFYVKTGKEVVATLFLQLSSKGMNSGTLTIDGLPGGGAYLLSDAQAGGGVSQWGNLNVLVTSAPQYTAAGTAIVLLKAGAGAQALMDDSDLTNTSFLGLTVSYQTGA